MKRLLFLSVSGEMGGSEAALVELIKGVRRLDPAWECSVLVPHEGGLAAEARSAGARILVLPMPAALARFGESTGRARIAGRGLALAAAAGSMRRYVRALGTAVARLQPHVVHSNGLKLHVLSALALPREVPLVWHMHEYVSPRPLTRSLLRRLAGRPHAIAANSRSVAADVASALGRADVDTIYNAVDLDSFAPGGSTADLDALSGLPAAAPGTVRVGLVATFGKWKGQLTFMNAVRSLAAEGRVRPYLIGDALYETHGSQFTRAELANEAGRLGLAGRIGMTGFIRPSAPALRALDVVVHASSQPEPFGLVIAEGMACGRAVVFSAAGGATELASDGVDAMAHVPGDAASLEAALRRVVSDPALRARLGAAARVTAERRFAPDVYAGQFIRTYERVFSHGRAVA